MKKINAVIFDKDDTFMKDQVYSPFISIDMLFDDTLEACRLLRSKEYILFVLSNQSGIERNYFSEDDLIASFYLFTEELKTSEIGISRFIYCSHTPEQNCECRKPKLGLFKQLNTLYQINESASYYLGDRLSDVVFAQNSGLHGVLIQRSNYVYKYDDSSHSKAQESGQVKLKFNSLIEFAKYL